MRLILLLGVQVQGLYYRLAALPVQPLLGLRLLHYLPLVHELLEQGLALDLVVHVQWVHGTGCGLVLI